MTTDASLYRLFEPRVPRVAQIFSLKISKILIHACPKKQRNEVKYDSKRTPACTLEVNAFVQLKKENSFLHRRGSYSSKASGVELEADSSGSSRSSLFFLPRRRRLYDRNVYYSIACMQKNRFSALLLFFSLSLLFLLLAASIFCFERSCASWF